MQKLLFKGLLLAILIIPTAFAEEELSPFNQGSDSDYQRAQPEENYIAVRATEERKFYRYFGINLGPTLTNLKPKITKNGTEDSLKSNPITYIIGGSAGIGTNFDRFYIGTELNVNYNTLDKTPVATTTATKLSIKQPLIAGLDLILGYLIGQNDLLFYCRLGIGSSLFKFKINNESDSGKSKIALGWRAGLGMKYFISDSCSTNLDYIFTAYNKIKKDYTSKIDGAVYAYEFPSPNIHQISLGFAVNF